jgi:hypothetical protein
MLQKTQLVQEFVMEKNSRKSNCIGKRTYTHGKCTTEVVQDDPRAGIACVVHFVFTEKEVGVLRRKI